MQVPTNIVLSSCCSLIMHCDLHGMRPRIKLQLCEAPTTLHWYQHLYILLQQPSHLTCIVLQKLVTINYLSYHSHLCNHSRKEEIFLERQGKDKLKRAQGKKEYSKIQLVG